MKPMNTMKELEQALQQPTSILQQQVDQLYRKGNNLALDLNQKINKISNMTIYWQLLNDKVKMPSKRFEDAGLDIYTIEDGVILRPNETRAFSTGLVSAFPAEFWIEIKERGSTGSVGLSVRSGVIDSGYRGEWKILLTNVNRFPVEFSSQVDKVTYVYGKLFKKRIKKIIYPISKGIAQAVVVPLPIVNCAPWDETQVAASERGTSGFGASGK